MRDIVNLLPTYPARARKYHRQASTSTIKPADGRSFSTPDPCLADTSPQLSLLSPSPFWSLQSTASSTAGKKSLHPIHTCRVTTYQLSRTGTSPPPQLPCFSNSRQWQRGPRTRYQCSTQRLRPPCTAGLVNLHTMVPVACDNQFAGREGIIWRWATPPSMEDGG